MKLDKCILKINSMNSEMKRIGRMLIANEQGRNFFCLNVVPKQSKHIRNLASLIVHAAIVFSARGDQAILLPFKNILQSPGMLKVDFLIS